MILPGGVICFLDMGMMGRLDRDTREKIVDLVLAVVKRDGSGLCKGPDPAHHLGGGTGPAGPGDATALELAERNLYKPLKEMSLVLFMYRLFEVASRHRLRIPMDVLFLIKALSSLEGLGRDLDPDFNLIETAAPFVERAHAERLHPKRVLEDLFSQGGEMIQLARDVPLEMRQVLRLVRQGKLKVDYENIGQEHMMKGLERSFTRLSFAIVLAALIVGSSLMVLSGIPPKWYDIPLIGLAGYLLAGIMGFWLLISALRKGKL